LKNKLVVQLCVASGNKSATDLAITDMDHKISALPGGAPLKDTYCDWFPDVALRVDVMMLEQVEALEDKVANASMQVKVSICQLYIARIHRSAQKPMIGFQLFVCNYEVGFSCIYVEKNTKSLDSDSHLWGISEELSNHTALISYNYDLTVVTV